MRPASTFSNIQLSNSRLGAMYAGLKVYGTFGFFLGPLSLIAIKAIVQAGIQYFQGINETKG